MRDFSTAADCTARLGLGPADQDQLKGFMGAASQMMVDFMNRDPRLGDYVDSLNGQGLTVLSVRQYPITTVTAVQVCGVAVPLDQIVWDDYAIIRRGQPFPRGVRNVQVTYSAGLDPAPKTLREAHLMAVTALWNARDVNPNATGESWAGVNSETWNANGPGYLPPACQAMIRSLVNPILVP